MTTPAPFGRPGIGLDLALNVLLAGVAFWAGMEWLRAAYEEGMDEVQRDVDFTLRRAARAAMDDYATTEGWTEMAAKVRTLMESEDAPPVEPKMAADPGMSPAVKVSRRTKFPRQGDATE